MKVTQFTRGIIATLFAVALLFLPGCRKKKPTLPPPQAQAPTTTAQPAPPTIAPGASANPTATQPPLPEASTTIPKPLPPKPKNRHHGVTNAKKQPPTTNPAPPAQAANVPPTNNEAVGQISPDIPSATENSTVQSTNQLLDSTEQNLRSINRRLSNEEQNILSDIRSYVAQSRAALKDQDFERAHNLAIKAHLLTDGLVKQ